jgi:hypothetical protein
MKSCMCASVSCLSAWRISGNTRRNEITLWSRVLFENLIIFQLVKGFLAFYGPRLFITVFIISLVLSLIQMHPAHTFVPKIHSNIFLPSTPRSFEWSIIPFRVSDKIFVYFSSIPCVLYAPPIFPPWFYLSSSSSSSSSFLCSPA